MRRMNYETGNAIPINGQRFLLEALIACGQERGDNILPLSVRLAFAKGSHDARRSFQPEECHSRRLRLEPDFYFTQW
jgi:hypothetical protein